MIEDKTYLGIFPTFVDHTNTICNNITGISNVFFIWTEYKLFDQSHTVSEVRSEPGKCDHCFYLNTIAIWTASGLLRRLNEPLDISAQETVTTAVVFTIISFSSTTIFIPGCKVFFLPLASRSCLLLINHIAVISTANCLLFASGVDIVGKSLIICLDPESSR